MEDDAIWVGTRQLCVNVDGGDHAAALPDWWPRAAMVAMRIAAIRFLVFMGIAILCRNEGQYRSAIFANSLHNTILQNMKACDKLARHRRTCNHYICICQ